MDSGVRQSQIDIQTVPFTQLITLSTLLNLFMPCAVVCVLDKIMSQLGDTILRNSNIYVMYLFR